MGASRDAPASRLRCRDANRPPERKPNRETRSERPHPAGESQCCPCLARTSPFLCASAGRYASDRAAGTGAGDTGTGGIGNPLSHSLPYVWRDLADSPRRSLRQRMARVLRLIPFGVQTATLSPPARANNENVCGHRDGCWVVADQNWTPAGCCCLRWFVLSKSSWNDPWSYPPYRLTNLKPGLPPGGHLWSAEGVVLMLGVWPIASICHAHQRFH